MREWIKKKVLAFLVAQAKKTLQRFHPMIIGVAGSIGKTSTKEAIFCAISQSFTVRKSTKSYNNEWGVPLTILGIESGYASPLEWFRVIRHARKVASGKGGKFPSVIILEMGSDHVGDVEQLMRLAPPTIGVLTAIAPVHLEFFGSFENVKKEESTIIRNLDGNAFGVVNGDDPDTYPVAKSSKVSCLTFGKNEGVDVLAKDILIHAAKNGVVGIQFTLWHQEKDVEVFLPNALGLPHVYSALAAAAVGIHLRMSLEDIAKGLLNFSPIAGRMRRVDGIKKTNIIDDTYNSSPKAVEAALHVLKEFPIAHHRFAVLGDMAELGNATPRLHHEVGLWVKPFADVLITVGEKAVHIAEGARESGMSEDKIFSFGKAKDAGKFLQERIHEQDVILVKGSQAVRLERIVKEIMQEPSQAKDILVRQEPYWQK